MAKWFWDISVFDSLDPIFHTRVAFHEMSEQAVKDCLRSLIAKHLEADEIVACHLNGRWGSKKRPVHLDVARSQGGGTYRHAWTCGGNPHAIAYPIQEDV